MFSQQKSVLEADWYILKYEVLNISVVNIPDWGWISYGSVYIGTLVLLQRDQLWLPMETSGLSKDARLLGVDDWPLLFFPVILSGYSSSILRAYSIIGNILSLPTS